MTTTLFQVIWTATINGHLSRADMLKMIGNDVCPQQGATALRELFGMMKEIS